jgi:hypothetical protein
VANNQHATWRLRELAYFEQNKAEEWEKHATSLVPPCGYSHRTCAKAADTCRFTSAALLAGAEVLERQERDLDAIKAADAALTEAMETISDLRGSLEVAKAALEQIITNRVGDLGRCGSRHCDCSECVATAALARLEEQ